MNEGIKKRLPTFGLLLVAMIWGAGFVFTQMAIDSGFSPGLILVSRFTVAALALMAVAGKRIFPLNRQEAVSGLIAGTFLFLGFYSQTAGLVITTPSNSGFFTVTNVIMVPFLAWAIHRRRPPIKLFGCSLMALGGFFILFWQAGQGFTVNSGDMLTLLCAFFYACHITSLGVLSAKVDFFRLTFLQLAFSALFSLVCVLAFELPALVAADIASGVKSILFLGLFSTCLCFLIQTAAQSRTSSGKAAVILSGEALWCMIFSVMAGYEAFTPRMVIGGVVIVGAICLLETDILLGG